MYALKTQRGVRKIYKWKCVFYVNAVSIARFISTQVYKYIGEYAAVSCRFKGNRTSKSNIPTSHINREKENNNNSLVARAAHFFRSHSSLCTTRSCHSLPIRIHRCCRCFARAHTKSGCFNSLAIIWRAPPHAANTHTIKHTHSQRAQAL